MPGRQRGEDRTGEGGVRDERERAPREDAGGRLPPRTRWDRPRGGPLRGLLDDEAAQVGEGRSGQPALDEQPELVDGGHREQPGVLKVREGPADGLLDNHIGRISAGPARWPRHNLSRPRSRERGYPAPTSRRRALARG
jgi:hypothetical protein